MLTQMYCTYRTGKLHLLMYSHLNFLTKWLSQVALSGCREAKIMARAQLDVTRLAHKTDNSTSHLCLHLVWKKISKPCQDVKDL